MSTKRTILTVNAGSSSVKLAVFEHPPSGGLVRKMDGAVERIGSPEAEAWVRVDGKRSATQAVRAEDQKAAFAILLSMLEKLEPIAPAMIAHRIVHGGPAHASPARVDAALVVELASLASLAPLHQAASMMALHAAQAHFHGVPQLACFDTAFHSTLPELARRLPIPEKFHAKGVRRYGFHGLSFENVVQSLGTPTPRRVVIAHLGSGSSIAAVRDGACIDTTMGFTPAGGVLMGTRTGDIDPGAILFMIRDAGLSADELEQLIFRESGLVALAGTPDMKTLTLRAETDERARFAVEAFGYSVRKAIGAMMAALGGADVLVFTGGIGEHSPVVRAQACAGLEAMGVHLDGERNRRSDDVLSAPSSSCVVRLIPADEERVLATLAVSAMT